MQENNFEKQVQQKMEALNVSPSGEVWSKVAAGIQKKKRDWKLLYFLLFICIAVITSTIVWVNNNTRDKGQHLTTAKKAPLDQQEKSGMIPSAEPVAKSGQTENELQQGAPVSRSTKEPATDHASPSRQSRTEDINPLAAGKTREIIRKQKTAKNLVLAESSRSIVTRKSGVAEEVGDASDDAATNVGGEQNDSQDIESKHGDLSGIDGKTSFKQGDTTRNAIDTLTASKPQELLTINSKAAKKQPSKEARKWQFGVQVAAGLSNTQNSYLGIASGNFANESFDYTQSPSNGSGSGSIGSSTKPSVVTGAGGFSVGLYGQKQVSSKVIVRLGLSYKYYSTKMGLGNRVDSFTNLSSDRFYYRAGTGISFHNRFHFVELPAGVLFRLNREQASMPIHLYTGITVSRLLKTTALQYDQASGSYYSNDEVFNKTQVDGSVALLFSPGKKGRFSFGPQLNYAFTKVANAGLYQQKHFSFLGVSIQKQIGKK